MTGIKIVVIHDNLAFESEIKYTFESILSIIGIDFEIKMVGDDINNGNLDESLLSIFYCHQKIFMKNKFFIQIIPSDFFDKSYLKRELLPKLPLRRTNDGTPIIYSGEDRKESARVEKYERSVKTNIDIIASSFFMLTRYEEVVKNEKDQFGRFPASASVACKEGFLDRPIVNEYAEMLWDWIDSFDLGFKRRKLWGSEIMESSIVG